MKTIVGLTATVIAVAMLFGIVSCAAEESEDDNAAPWKSEQPVSPENHLEKTELILATFNELGVRYAVSEFNRANTDYYITVQDYAEYTTSADGNIVITSHSNGIKRLTTEILSGKVPDIIDTASVPYAHYIARGYLEDLYPYIDSDSEFERSDFFENVIRLTEVDGGLYRIFPRFSIATVVGSPHVLGPDMGWTVDEFVAVLDEKPGYGIPLGPHFHRMRVLRALCNHEISSFVDWDAGTVDFDNARFKKLLEFSSIFPETIDTQSTETELIVSGSLFALGVSLFDFGDYLLYKTLFGGEIVFKGYPIDSRNGHSLEVWAHSYAMTSTSANKEGVWAFLRMFLYEDQELDYGMRGFPINRAAFDEMARQAMEEDEALTHSDVDHLLTLIDAMSATSEGGLTEQGWAIIAEDADRYFNGIRSVDDTARTVQNRMSILVSELS